MPSRAKCPRRLARARDPRRGLRAGPSAPQRYPTAVLPPPPPAKTNRAISSPDAYQRGRPPRQPPEWVGPIAAPFGSLCSANMRRLRSVLRKRRAQQRVPESKQEEFGGGANRPLSQTVENPGCTCPVTASAAASPVALSPANPRTAGIASAAKREQPVVTTTRRVRRLRRPALGGACLIDRRAPRTRSKSAIPTTGSLAAEAGFRTCVSAFQKVRCGSGRNAEAAEAGRGFAGNGGNRGPRRTPVGERSCAGTR